MTTGENDNKSFSTADILRYVSGEMSPAERHAIEKQALEDTFLADAIEGMEQRRPDELAQDLSIIADRLEKRVGQDRRSRIVPFYKVAAAAAVFLLAGSLSIIYFLNQGNKAGPDTVATDLSEKRSVEPAPTQLPDSVNMAPGLLSTPHLPSEQRMLNAEATPPPPAKDQARIAPPALREKMTPPVIVSDAEVSTASASHRNEKESSDQILMRQAPATPMPMQKSSDTSTMVVGYGTVKMSSSSDSLQRRQLAEVRVDDERNKQGNQVTKALEGKVAGVSVTKASKKKAAREVSITPAENISDTLNFRPTSSWQAYNGYLQRNLSGNQAEGEILMRFRINASGKPADIQILRSANESLNTKIRRLIRTGPRWQLSSGTESTVKVLVRF